MKFLPGKREDFLEVFESSKAAIASFEGCLHLELLNDKSDSNRFFTYSHWESEKHLEDYRNSELFKNTWSKTKILFERRASASSFDALFSSSSKY
ncbi:MAG: antibiotic biosynthesis monooxygenase family protein [Bacteroidia bacterium]